MPSPKVVVTALKISVWISEWHHSSLAQTGIYFSTMNYQEWARLSVSVISQDFIHLKNLLTHLRVFFFSVRLSCAIITYGVSGDILINQTRKKTEEIIVVLFADYSMEHVGPTVNVDGYKNFFNEKYIWLFLFFGYQSYLRYVFYFCYDILF